jgi:hypothetical protein
MKTGYRLLPSPDDFTLWIEEKLGKLVSLPFFDVVVAFSFGN